MRQPTVAWAGQSSSSAGDGGVKAPCWCDDAHHLGGRSQFKVYSNRKAIVQRQLKHTHDLCMERALGKNRVRVWGWAFGGVYNLGTKLEAWQLRCPAAPSSIPQRAHGGHPSLDPCGRVWLAQVVGERGGAGLGRRCQLNGHNEVGGVASRGQNALHPTHKCGKFVVRKHNAPHIARRTQSCMQVLGHLPALCTVLWIEAEGAGVGKGSGSAVWNGS